MSPKILKRDSHVSEYESYIHQLTLKEKPVDQTYWTNTYAVCNRPETKTDQRGKEVIITPITTRNCTLIWAGNRFIETEVVPGWWVV